MQLVNDTCEFGWADGPNVQCANAATHLNLASGRKACPWHVQKLSSVLKLFVPINIEAEVCANLKKAA